MSELIGNNADEFPELFENHRAYNEMREEIEAEHFGKVALMHNRQVVGYYESRGDAYSIGCDKYGLGHFLLKTVGEKPISLGVQVLCFQSPDNSAR